MNDLIADAATAMALGKRQRQEDAVVTDFAQGSEMGLAVLSDGMGGHSAGDIASRIIVTEMFGELFYSSAKIEQLRENAVGILKGALAAANQSLRAHAEARSGQEGMGGTVIGLVLMDEGLRWISVGDSPLYLFRDGELNRLNEDHSMAPQIDHMAREGIIDAESARNHPQRNCLTSALTGGDIDKIDCPKAAFELKAGDIIVMASDGLQVLDDHAIERILSFNRHKSSRRIAGVFLDAVNSLDEPNQDNVSLAVIKLNAGQSHFQIKAGQDVVDVPAALAAGGRRLLSPMRQFLGQVRRRGA